MWIPRSAKFTANKNKAPGTGTPASADTIHCWRYEPTPEEIVGARLRGGASRAGNVHFIAETIHRVRRAGAKGPIMIRTDAGFWSYALIKRLKQLGVDWSVTVPQYQKVKDAAEAIPDIEWETIPYTKGGEAQVADTLLLSKNRPVVRLVIRRTRLTDPAQQRLWPQWRHHVFATSTDHDPVEADRSHRAHARCMRTSHTGHQSPLGPLSPTLRAVRGERRLAGCRRSRPQHIPVDSRSQRHTTRQTGQRQHRPPTPVPNTRKDRQPRQETDPTPTPQMAMGKNLSQHPHRHPFHPPTLLNTQSTPQIPENRAPPPWYRTSQTSSNTPNPTPHRPPNPTNPKTRPPNAPKQGNPTPNTPTPPSHHPTHTTERWIEA